MLFDDPASLEPADVLDWFELCIAGLAREEQDAYRLWDVAIGSPPPALLFDVLEVGASREDIREHFMACREELELAAVLTLTAAAEARIRLDAVRRMESSRGDLAQRLRLLRSNARVEWRIPLYDRGIVDAWKMYIGSLADLLKDDRARLLTSIGRFRNLLDIRHWLAHGRYWELQRGIEHCAPNDAATMVSELFAALDKAASHGSLPSFA